MLMSASSNDVLTIASGSSRFSGHSRRSGQRHHRHPPGTGGRLRPRNPSRPFRTASIDHIQCGHLDCDSRGARTGADLGLYSVTFNNDLERDMETLEHFHRFREEAERKGFRYFLEIFDPNIPSAIAADILPHYINDTITRMLAGVSPSGRPLFLKIVYHGPKAMEELVRFDPHLIVGILGRHPPVPLAMPFNFCPTPRNTGPGWPSSAARSIVRKTSLPSCNSCA